MIGSMLITGCSTGLGLALAVQGAGTGFRVFATMRDLTKREELDGVVEAASVELDVLELDVQSAESMNFAVQQVIDRAAIMLDCIALPKPRVRLRTSQWAEDLCMLKTQTDPEGIKLRTQVIERFPGGMI